MHGKSQEAVTVNLSYPNVDNKLLLSLLGCNVILGADETQTMHQFEQSHSRQTCIM